MSMQAINVGTAVNDGTGDKLRVAGQKINANFAEVYEAIAQGTGPDEALTERVTDAEEVLDVLTAPNLNYGTSITASGVFPSARYGQLVRVTANNVAITFPSASGVAEGTLIDLWFVGGAGTANGVAVQAGGRILSAVSNGAWVQMRPFEAAGTGGAVLPEYSMFWMEVLSISPDYQDGPFYPTVLGGLRIYDDTMTPIDISGATFSGSPIAVGTANAATLADDSSSTRIETLNPYDSGQSNPYHSVVLKVGFVLPTPERPAYFGFQGYSASLAAGPDKFKLYAGSADQILTGGTLVIDESAHVAVASGNPWGQVGEAFTVVPITYPTGL